jgi:hypothetical protein
MKMARKKSAPDDEPPKTFKIEEAREAKLLSDNAVRLAEVAAKALVAAEAKGTKTKPLENFWLAPAQRGLLLNVPGISKEIKAKLTRKKASLTVSDVASLTMSLAEASMECEAERRIACLLVAKHLTERLEDGIAAASESKPRKAKVPKTKADPNAVYQFKITLIGSNPPIWRRATVSAGSAAERCRRSPPLVAGLLGQNASPARPHRPPRRIPPGSRTPSPASCHPPLAKPGIRGFFSGYGMFCVSSVVESINL